MPQQYTTEVKITLTIDHDFRQTIASRYKISAEEVKQTHVHMMIDEALQNWLKSQEKQN